MYLSKLEIFGFKSFASKTMINFTSGITGIVGPNGCGKTNIVDGIRWCLGEQKSSMLRSDKMENVIFNGTKNKKPMGMSEVSLTLQNDKGILPSEYSEITITRRIFRSGESEYLLNKNICRLKDITNLFMDTGMGTNAYSVIELKMVETILSNRAEERRNMFEEAAGVNKYKLRRRLSLKKLDEVKSDLVRVNDIISEVEKTVRSLSRQAKKADKYNQFQSVLREKEIDLCEREFSKFSLRRNELTENLEVQKERKNEVDESIRNIEHHLIEFRDSIQQIELKLSQKRSEISKQTETLHDVQNSISVSQERTRSYNNNIATYSEELEEFKNQIIEIDETIEKNKSEIEELDLKIDEKYGDIAEEETKVSERRKVLEDKKLVLKTERKAAINIYKEIDSKENSVAGLKKALGKINGEINAQEEFIQKSTNSIAKTVGYIEDLENERRFTKDKIEETEARYSEQQKKREDLEKELNDLKNRELDEKGILNGLRNKIELLQTMITNLEGISSASRQLIEYEGWTKKDKSIFADVGEADEKYRFAIDAALGRVINNLLIENLNDLKSAVSYLKKNDLGKASFYLLNMKNKSKGFINKLRTLRNSRESIKVKNEKGFVGWAYNYVKSSAKWKPYFEKVLSNSVLVNNMETALKLSKKYPRYVFVSLDGDTVRSDGTIEAGSPAKLDETLFGRKQLLDSLKDEYPEVESRLKELADIITKTEEELSSINLKGLSDEGRTLLNEFNNIEKQIAQLEFEKNKYSEEIENSRDKIQSLANEASQLNQEINSLQTEIDAQINLRNETEQKLRDKEDELRNFEHEYDEAVAQFNSQKVELERLRGTLQNTKNSIGNSEETKAKVLSAIEKRKRDIDLANEELVTIKAMLEEKEIEYEELIEVRGVLEEEYNKIKSELDEQKGEASNYEKELNQFRNERETISDSVHEIDIELNRIEMKVSSLKEHIMEEYSVQLEIKEYTDLGEFNFEERNREVHDLKRQIKELGPINLLAYSEFEEEQERLDFLHKQRDDLIGSEKDLIDTINEINEAAQKIFLETFQLIRENFIKIFRTLFDPGDEADLLLQEGVDPLEAKIEILAKPKGKRPTSIELLSGGEKTLTATALLFAIYLVKPSPFCILDEVDAPLDDANIDRFTRLLSEFSKNTQFIIVTHNKRTMNAAENMYGVTMQEEGISKIAGVQFNDQIQVEA